MGGHNHRSTSAISCGENRLDIFQISDDGTAMHKYWDESGWQPQESDQFEKMGGNFASSLVAASSRANRMDLIGRGHDRKYYHKYWDRNNWSKWEDFGGKFISEPAMTSTKKNSIDIFDIEKDGKLVQKYWSGSGWEPSVTDWEDMGGVPFVGTPVASTWGPGMLSCLSFTRPSPRC